MDNEKYYRNILEGELCEFDEVNEEGQNKLRNAKVLIAGKGSLSKKVTKLLFQKGINTIGIIDKDISNIADYETNNPCLNLNIHNSEISENNFIEIVQSYDIIVDCLDNYKAKSLLNKIVVKLRKPLIHSGITEISGQITTVLPGVSACLNCIFPNKDNDFYIPKEVKSPFEDTIANIITLEVLKLILALDGVLSQHLLTYYSDSSDFEKIKLTKNNKCTVCSNFNAQ